MRKRKPKKVVPAPIPELHNVDGNQYLLIKLPADAMNFVVDNAMGYLIYKVPNYKNWITDDELWDLGKLVNFLDTHNAGDDFVNAGCKLPDGEWEIITDMKEFFKVPASHDSKSTLILKQANY